MSAVVLAESAATGAVDEELPPMPTVAGNAEVEVVAKPALLASEEATASNDAVKPAKLEADSCAAADGVAEKLAALEVADNDHVPPRAGDDNTGNSDDTQATVAAAAAPSAEPSSTVLATTPNATAPEAAAASSSSSMASSLAVVDDAKSDLEVDGCNNKALIDDDKKSAAAVVTSATSDSEDLAESECGAVTTLSVSDFLFLSFRRNIRMDS